MLSGHAKQRQGFLCVHKTARILRPILGVQMKLKLRGLPPLLTEAPPRLCPEFCVHRSFLFLSSQMDPKTESPPPPPPNLELPVLDIIFPKEINMQETLGPLPVEQHSDSLEGEIVNTPVALSTQDQLLSSVIPQRGYCVGSSMSYVADPRYRSIWEVL